MKCSVVLTAETSRVDGDESSIEHLQDHFTEVMDALADQEACDERLSDADMNVNLMEHEATFSVDVEAETLDEAVLIGQAALRAAIHDAGGFTPGWERHHWSVELGEDTDEDELVLTR